MFRGFNLMGALYRALCYSVVVVASCPIRIDNDQTITAADLPNYLQTRPECPAQSVNVVIISSVRLSTLLANTFSNLPNLQQINITDAGLVTIPSDLFRSLDSLNVITLSGNKLLTTLPNGLFETNNKLKTLYLDNNGLNYLPNNVFSGASAVTLLDLSLNALNGFEAGTFNGLTSLAELYLQSNKLISANVHSNILDMCPLTKVDVRNNPNLDTLPPNIFNSAVLLAANFVLLANGDLPCGSCLLSGCATCGGLLSNCCYHPTKPTSSPTTLKPTAPSRAPTRTPTTMFPTLSPSFSPTTLSPSSRSPSTNNPTTGRPTLQPSAHPSSLSPSSLSPSSLSPSSLSPSTYSPTFTLAPTSAPTLSLIVSTAAPSLSPTSSPSTLAPSNVAALQTQTTKPMFPWVYVLVGAVGLMCVISVLVLYLRRRRNLQRSRLVNSYMKGDTTSRSSRRAPGEHNSQSPSPSSSSSTTSSAANSHMDVREFRSGSHSPSGSVDGSTGFFDHSLNSRRVADAREPSVHRSTHREGTMVEINPQEIEVGSKLGNGAFGSVHQCLWRGTDYALKSLLNPNQEVAFEKEVEINRVLSAMPHIHVTRMVGVTSNPTGIVMELYPMGSVEDYLRSNLLTPEDYPHVLTILITASAGVMHLHSQGIIHRDVAARNFLVKKDHSAAICDFGLALALPEGKKVGQRSPQERETDMLPINIAAPETLNQGQYSSASDVYMFGMFMWEVIARQIPHGSRPEFSSTPKDFPGFIARVVKDDLRPMVPLDWPPVLRSLILQCWDKNPANRPTLNHINNTLRVCRAEALANLVPLPAPRTKAFQVVDSQVYYADAPIPPSSISRSNSFISLPPSANVSRSNSILLTPMSHNNSVGGGSSGSLRLPSSSISLSSLPPGHTYSPATYHERLTLPSTYGSGELYGSCNPSPRSSFSFTTPRKKQ